MGTSSIPDSSANRKAVVLTAIELEFKAVCAHLRDCQEERSQNGTSYMRGWLDTEGSAWDVLVGQTGQTNQRARQRPNAPSLIFNLA
jgi:hypothetical protein